MYILGGVVCLELAYCEGELGGVDSPRGSRHSWWVGRWGGLATEGRVAYGVACLELSCCEGELGASEPARKDGSLHSRFTSGPGELAIEGGTPDGVACLELVWYREGLVAGVDHDEGGCAVVYEAGEVWVVVCGLAGLADDLMTDIVE